MATIRSFGFGRHSKEKKIHGMDASIMHQGSIKFSKKPSQDLGVVVPSATGDSRYLIDVLRHEGLYHDVYNVELFRSLKSYPPLIIILGPVKLDPPIVNRLRTHAFSGGGVMTIGFVEALEGLLGTMIRYPLFPFPIGGQSNNMVGEGYLVPRVTGEGITKVIDANWMPLHGFGCVPTMADGCTIHAWYEPEHECKDELTAITVNHLGRGIALGFHVDLPGTLRHMQEGIYVDKDGIPPPDGMSPVDDGILKAEDGLVLDWTKDRRVVSETHQVPAFTIPVADAWRRLFRSSIEFMADECNVRIQRMDYWPNGSSFIALLSHDTDGNDEKLARILLEGINQHGINTTWCLQTPGYSKDLCQEILSHGHEIGFHFDAISNAGKKKTLKSMSCLWTVTELERQLKTVQKRTGVFPLYTNKNHYTRWEGRTEFLEWCEELGIRVDQTKGPSKCGTQGFPFGSCHPWQAMDIDGKLIGCLEISFQSQDFGLQGPEDTMDILLDGVVKAAGVAHVIFHPAHATKPRVNALMHEFITKCKELGASFMKSKDIGEWVFKRKLAIAKGIQDLDGASIKEREPGKKEWVPITTKS